jgi:hypothetical protein
MIARVLKLAIVVSVVRRAAGQWHDVEPPSAPPPA